MHHLKSKFGTIAIVLTLVFCSLRIFVPSASAADDVFKIQDVSIETTSGEIIDFDEANITSSAALSKVGKIAKYTITIRNTDDVAHVIENITDNNVNPYVSYEYNPHIDEIIDPGSDLVLDVTTKYIYYITDENDREQTNNVKFQIKFSDIPLAPDTGSLIFFGDDGASISSSFIVPAVWLVAVVILIKYKKRAKYIIAAAAITLTASAPSVARGITYINEFVLGTNFTLELGRLIHYDGNWPDDGEMTDDHLSTDGTLKPNAYTAIGYHFGGWSLVADRDKVYDDEEPMSNIPDEDGPLTLFVVWEPNTYTIYFHANSEEVTTTMDPIEAEFDSYRYLPHNTFVREGYQFTGWKRDNEGSLISDGYYADTFDTEDGGEVHLYAQWRVAPVGIDYYGNGAGVSGVTQRQENLGRSTILRTPNYLRDGYGFAGWNTEPDGTGTMYGPNETITSPKTESLKLYATWVKAEEDVTMQTFDSTAEPYASYPIGKVIALKDNRDNQVYTVAKLSDNQWWMTENLRLVPGGVQFTAENTNNPTDNFLSMTATTSLCTENTASCINRLAYNDTNLRIGGSSLFSSYRAGVYYNVFAATAGHAAVDPDNPVTGQVAGDICPKGWHLPTTNGDFKNLDISLGGDGMNSVGNLAFAQQYFKTPINFVAAGWAEGYYLHNSTSDAVYLEAGTNNLEHSISLFVDIASQIRGETTLKYYAHTVRCIAN